MRLFSSNKSDNTFVAQKGLSVSVDELISMQQYLPYLALKQNQFTSNRAGDVKSVFKGRGMELEEVRAYNFGDDIRDIDWRVTARKSEPYTKVFNEEKDREIVVVLDLSSSMVFGTRNELKSVTACKMAALIGWMTIKKKDRFGLLLYDGQNTIYFKPQNNMRNLMAIFKKISDYSAKVLQNQHRGDLSKALNLLEYNNKGKGTIFILSDFYGFDNDKFKKIAALSHKHQIYCINIFDRIEELAPSDGVYAAQYEAQKTVFDSSVVSFREAYKEYFMQNHNMLKKNCQQFLCRYMEIRTDVPIFKQLSLV